MQDQKSPKFHYWTYGHLISGLVEACGSDSIEEIFRTQIAQPIDVDDDIFLKTPDDIDQGNH